MSLVVILDDRPTNRNIFSRLAASLESQVTVQAFGDPLEALDWLAGHTPDLVIADYKMPNLDGAEFTRRLRGNPHVADVPVIVITAYDDRSFRLQALEAGATDFLQSPVDHHEFVTRARNLLRLRRQQQRVKRRAATLERELERTRRSQEEALRSSRDALAQVIDTLPAMISAADRDGRCVFVNAYQAAISGSTTAALVGEDVAAVFGSERGARSRQMDQLVFASGEPLPSYEEVVERSGVRQVFLTSKAPLRDAANQVESVLTTALDITDRKLAEEHLHHLANHDALTDLPNRVHLLNRIRRILGRDPDAPFALHFLDLDRFKSINDALGHHFGDQILQEVARRLSLTARPGDIIARLGGDEFAVLQLGLARGEDAAAAAAQILQEIARPHIRNDSTVSLTASIGITLHPRDGNDPDQLFRNADLAMYRAKADGPGEYRFFATELNASIQDAVVLETELRAAVEADQFVLHYQPQVDLHSGRIVAAEALMRWQHPTRGLLLPAQFLPAAEETGLIIAMNTWALREACMQAAAWARDGLALRVGVNLTSLQFRKQDIGRLIRQTLEDSGLAPSALELELTEGVLMQNAESAASRIQELRGLGVRFAIDDFGTGYSSLNYLKIFPVNRLKIDRSFIRNLETSPGDAAIVRAITNLGHDLGLDVTAEGVETPEQLETVRMLGCDEVQGFHFARPMPDDQLRDFVRRWTADRRIS
ncbi:EAL domain-containing response regulator [Inquilinus limosus]|uniref:Diguanylate cyclase n=1 Tax=Inquilinus limosus TaxID=171674 RepID=A0A211YYG9_9PROT|nr:EAL domain-containing protein [Inquilinus limosus]OWJ58073.1 diguanylate cyclase [Inquilinus limosus]